MNDKKLLINALLLLVFALGIVYSFRYTQHQNSLNKISNSSSSYNDYGIIGFSSSISAKKVAQVASSVSSDIRYLSQSSLVEDTLPIEKTLGLKPRYTLKYLDTYIFNLGKSRDIDSLSSKVKSLGGEINPMTPSEIEKYDLPGQKASFINIPSTKDTYVLLAVFDGKDMWLADIPASTYQTRKKSLKILFDQ